MWNHLSMQIVILKEISFWVKIEKKNKTDCKAIITNCQQMLHMYDFSNLIVNNFITIDNDYRKKRYVSTCIFFLQNFPHKPSKNIIAL